MDVYETPLGSLKLDKEILSKLKSTQQFRVMSRQIDEDEHSIEMQLPYLARVFQHRLDEVAFVPVLVGSLDGDALDMYRPGGDDYEIWMININIFSYILNFAVFFLLDLNDPIYCKIKK